MGTRAVSGGARVPFHGRVIWILACSLLASCEKFEYSPYATVTPESEHGLTAVNLARLAAQEAADDDTVTFLFTGDSQRFYEEQEAMVAMANSIPNVDFFILAGDIVDFGLVQEFEWTVARLNELNMPWLTVIGNHDHQANGVLIYQHQFGPLNYAFTYKGHRFLFHDTNGREQANDGTVPDLGWLSAQLEDANAQHIIAVSHVPPMNGDFDPDLVDPYTGLLASDPRMVASLHAHQGSYFNDHPYGEAVRYIVCNAMSNPEFLLVKLYGGELHAQVLRYD